MKGAFHMWGVCSRCTEAEGRCAWWDFVIKSKWAMLKNISPWIYICSSLANLRMMKRLWCHSWSVKLLQRKERWTIVERQFVFNASMCSAFPVLNPLSFQIPLVWCEIIFWLNMHGQRHNMCELSSSLKVKWMLVHFQRVVSSCSSSGCLILRCMTWLTVYHHTLS